MLRAVTPQRWPALAAEAARYTELVANAAESASTQPAPGQPEEGPATRPAPAPERESISPPSFYLTGRQPLSPAAILLAFVAAGAALTLILFVLSHGMANAGAGQQDTDDPDQVDVIVIGSSGKPTGGKHPGAGPSTVHPTILVHLPRFGPQMGLIPATPAGHQLYDWLAAFNHASPSALARTLPPSAAAAQLELRRQTGGFSLLSAKEVEPGILVFRLLDQTPASNEVLGLLQVDPLAPKAAIAGFSLRALPARPHAPASKPAQ